MSNGWRRSFPKKQSMFEFKILVPDLDCVRVADFTCQRCVPQEYSCNFYQSGNQWKQNKTTPTWKCCATLVLSEVRKWSTNLHFEIIFLIAQFRHRQFFISWIRNYDINPLNAELNPICCLLALLGAHHFLHVSRIRVKLLTLRLLMSYIYTWSTYSWCF